MRVLVVDNQDSFTFNLVEYMRAEPGVSVEVVSNAAPAPSLAEFDAIVISPGPGTPERADDAGCSAAVLAAAIADNVPLLGVCFGHQLIAHHFGARITRAAPAHGQVDTITAVDSPLFAGLNQRFDVVRYHSLVAEDLPKSLRVTARTDDGLVMALEHTDLPLYGVQFHPESIGADVDAGTQVLRNFLALVATRRPYAQVFEAEVTASITAALFSGLYGASEEAVWLDDSTASSVSYLAQPSKVVEDQHPFDIPKVTRPHDPALGLSFQLGWIGYVGYEGDGWLGRIDAMVACDHAGGRIVVMADDPEWVYATADKVRRIIDDPQKPQPAWIRGELVPDVGHEEYLQAIGAAQELIRAGESYEVCLTTQLRVSARVDDLGVYVRLRADQPTSTSGFIRTKELSVLSSSPETFVEVDERRRISTRPIKGTRPRGATALEDEALKRDLAANPKDRAENLMIVDLVRHDLTSIAVPGTTWVEAAFEVETYASVHQLVSTVSAQVADGLTPAKAAEALFPGGSMTGAPKKRTMEIIDDLEVAPRGVYSGAFGYFSETGPVRLAMTIRTLVTSDDGVSYGVGGAILAVSDPEAEYEETVTKSAPLRRLLR